MAPQLLKEPRGSVSQKNVGREKLYESDPNLGIRRNNDVWDFSSGWK
jgi:hypothetical protein